MKAGIIKLGISFLPEMWMLLTGGIPKLVLMAEFRGETQRRRRQAQRLLAGDIKKSKSHVRARGRRSEAQRAKYWVIRERVLICCAKKSEASAPRRLSTTLSCRRQAPEFLPKLEEILSKYNLTYTIAGHVGDGNFHIIPLVDPTDPTRLPKRSMSSRTSV
jgi:D-lactate dehydrogenase (cytochrome)